MNCFKTRHKIWIKVIATVVVCLFTVNTISWAYPDPAPRVLFKNDTLQVQSMFNPILKKVGWQYASQVKTEILRPNLFEQSAVHAGDF